MGELKYTLVGPLEEMLGPLKNGDAVDFAELQGAVFRLSDTLVMKAWQTEEGWYIAILEEVS